MADASTRAHVVSFKTEQEQPIPVADLGIHQTLESSDADTDSAIEPTIPLSRKEKRKLKHKRHDSALPTPSDTDTESSHPRKPPNNPPKQKQQPTTDLSIPRALAPMAKNAAQKAYPLLICSIGNPGAAYANTLHSAGHILTSYIAARKSYLPFTKGLSGLVSRPDTSHLAFHSIMQGFRRTSGAPVSIDEDWTLWQSTSLMNVSGKGVQRAYAEWLRGLRAQYGDATLEGRLIVVHDELESALGKVTVRDGGASAKGHNGLKSCGASLGRTKWWRVGVGIGRPESREPADVARYVLKKVTERERAVLEDCAIKVVDALEDIASGRK